MVGKRCICNMKKLLAILALCVLSACSESRAYLAENAKQKCMNARNLIIRIQKDAYELSNGYYNYLDNDDVLNKIMPKASEAASELDKAVELLDDILYNKNHQREPYSTAWKARHNLRPCAENLRYLYQHNNPKIINNIVTQIDKDINSVVHDLDYLRFEL